MGEVAVEINKPSFTPSTNWIISNGSLADSISFETPIEEDEFQDSRTLKHQKQILVLTPSSSTDASSSPPCEIKLSFKQRHEIRQVYVRSTARIYEIYYETTPESSNEYLCTVRCGVAAKEELPLGPNDTEETTSAHSEGSEDHKELPGENVKRDSNGSADEDGWVEISVPGSALLDNKGYSLVRNINGDSERRNQEFYEATAEITDSNPCISITLRLLSLHTKGCIHLEEIYIYGEPVEPSESDCNVDPVKSTAGSSMMAMLVPTLLQISRTEMSKSAQDKHVSDVRQELKHQDNESVGHCVGSMTHEEVQSCAPSKEEKKMDAMAKENPEAAQMQSDETVQSTGLRPGFGDRLNDSSSGRIEKVLDQLVGRVCRIEAFCSRFEDNMLKPITNIEARLDHLEQQLEALTMRSQNSEFYPHTRISAPDFSCIESETNSLQNDENENTHYGVSDIASKDAKSDKRPESFGDESESSSPLNDRHDDHCRLESESFLSDDACESVVAPRLLPCLIVSAPEFSNKDDDDDDDYVNEDDGNHCDGVGNGDDKTCFDDCVSSKTDFPAYKPSLSLDDALAMALAGFMSSSDHPPRTNRSWTVEAPDFPDDNNDSNDSLNTPLRSTDKEVQVMRLTTDVSTEAVDGSCGDKSVNQSIAGDSDEEEREVNNCSLGNPNNGFSIIKSSQATDASCEAVKGSCGHKSVSRHITEDSDDEVVNNYSMEGTINEFATMNTSRAEIQVLRSSDADSTEAVIRGCPLLEEGIDGSCDERSVNQTITPNNDELTGEVSNYKMEHISSGHDTLSMDSNLNLSRNIKEDKELVGNSDEETMLDQNFVIDFELPILDVKFRSLEHLDSRCSFESLFNASSVNVVDNPSAKDDGCNVVISEEEDELKGSEVDHLLVDVDNVKETVVNSSILENFPLEDASENTLDDSCEVDDNFSIAVTGLRRVLFENDSTGPEDAHHLLVDNSDDTDNSGVQVIDSNLQSPSINSKVPDLLEGIGSKIPDWFEISSYI